MAEHKRNRLLMIATLVIASAALAGAQTPAEETARAAAEIPTLLHLADTEADLQAWILAGAKPSAEAAQATLAEELSVVMRWTPQKAVANLEPVAASSYPIVPDANYNFVFQYKEAGQDPEKSVLQSLRSLPSGFFSNSRYGGPFEQSHEQILRLTW